MQGRCRSAIHSYLMTINSVLTSALKFQFRQPLNDEHLDMKSSTPTVYTYYVWHEFKS